MGNKPVQIPPEMWGIGVFGDYMRMLVQLEGVYSNDPNDPGGVTYYGIAKNRHPEFPFDKIFDGSAEFLSRKILEFYEQNFFINIIPIGAHSFYMLSVSCMTNIGVKAYFKIAQSAINNISKDKIKVDGVFGEKSMSALKKIDAYNQHLLIQSFVLEWADYYRNLNSVRYINGWMNRIRKTLFIMFNG